MGGHGLCPLPILQLTHKLIHPLNCVVPVECISESERIKALGNGALRLRLTAPYRTVYLCPTSLIN
jgi:hypothetical protein